MYASLCFNYLLWSLYLYVYTYATSTEFYYNFIWYMLTGLHVVVVTLECIKINHGSTDIVLLAFLRIYVIYVNINSVKDIVTGHWEWTSSVGGIPCLNTDSPGHILFIAATILVDFLNWKLKFILKCFSIFKCVRVFIVVSTLTL